MQHKIKKQVSFLLAIVMIFSMVTYPTSNVYANDISNETTKSNEVNVIENKDAQIKHEKIEEEVLKEFETKENVQFIVKMKEQVDVVDVENEAKQFRMAASVSLPKSKDNINNYALNSMQHVQEQTQEKAIEFLKRAEKNGQVLNYESFFIVNSIFVTANKEACLYLASLDEVEKICENKKYKNAEYKETGVFTQNDANAANSSDGELELPWNLKSIHVDKAWEKGYKGEGIVVGVIDSGADYTHEAIKNSWRGADENGEVTDSKYSSYIDATSSATSKPSELPKDETGHGSHVIGTIAGKDCGNGMALGLAPKSKWIVAKVFDEHGESDTASLLRAGEWMLAPKDASGKAQTSLAPDVINNSWSGTDNDEFFRDVLVKWRQAGIVPVFSAGNKHPGKPVKASSVEAPAKYPEAFAVGAIDQNDKLAKFSLIGPASFLEQGKTEPTIIENKPEIVAPGVNIKSVKNGGGYTLMSGTSMAGPHITGVVALLKQANPALTVDQIEEIIKSTADPLTDDKFISSPNNGYGYGKVNVYRAIEKALPNGSGFGKIEGSVYVKGTDEGGLELNHIPFKTLFKGKETKFEALVKDDNGIKSVKLYVKKSGETSFKSFDMDLIYGNKKNGEYSVSVNSDEFGDISITYYIKAEDINGNIHKSEEFNAGVSGGIKIGYKQDFEAEADGFVLQDFEIGKPTEGLQSAASGEKCVGTNLSGTYANLDEPVMISPLIDLTDNKKAAIQFKQFYALDNYKTSFYDKAEVWVGEVNSSNQEKIKYTKVKDFKNRIYSWEEQYVDLSAFAGKKVQIMFGIRFGESSPKNKAGWYIDDFEIVEASTEKPATPSKYLEGEFDYSKGMFKIDFGKIDDSKIDSYNLYGKHDNEEFKLIKKFPAGDFSYTVTLNHTPNIQKGKYSYYATSCVGEIESEATEIFSHTFTEGKKIVEYNFETGAEGWTSEGDSKWTRGVPDETKSTNPTPSNIMPTKNTLKTKNIDSPNVWGTELSEKRNDSAEYTLASPEIDLSQAEKARIYFQNWFNTRGRRGSVDYYGTFYTYNEDYLKYYFSKDGGNTWSDEKYYVKVEDDGTEFDDLPKNTPAGIWFTDNIDVDEEYKTDKFKIKFVLDATDNTGGETEFFGGWYLDDIMVCDIANSSASSNSFEENNFEEEISYEPFSLKSEKIDYHLNGGAAKNNNAKIPMYTKVYSNTGLNTKTEIGSGDYQIVHPVGSYEFIVDEPGYEKQSYTLEIKEGEIIKQDFILEKKSSTKASLKVVDNKNQPIEGASISLVGEGISQKVISSDEGKAEIEELYAGNYALIVSKNGYEKYKSDIKINKKNNDLGTVVLTKLIAASGEKELKKDNGYEYGSEYKKMKDGTTVAVKFNTDEAKLIKKIKLYFGYNWDDDKASEFEYSIYGANTNDGLAGNIIAGPYKASFEKSVGWAEIDLPESVTVNGEFYIAYTDLRGKKSPLKLRMDDNSDAEDTYVLVSGAWVRPSQSGNFMIRLVVSSYELEPSPIKKYELKVNNGTGSGEYEKGAEVSVKADAAEAGKIFEKWELIAGTLSGVDLSKSDLSFEMPEGNIELSVKYKLKNESSNSSSSSYYGGGSYYPPSSSSSSSSSGSGSSSVKTDDKKAEDKKDKDKKTEDKKSEDKKADGKKAESDKTKADSLGDNIQAQVARTPVPIVIENIVTESEAKEIVENFDDVKGHWAKESVVKVVKMGIFKGTSEKEFSSEAKMTRAMVFTVLHRISGDKSDSDSEIWYESAMNWSKNMKISDGTEPNKEVSREQFATMLYRFVGEPAVEQDLSNFSDSKGISDYANKAIQWAVSSGIMNGQSETKLNPQGYSSRAEVATMVSRFVDKYGDK